VSSVRSRLAEDATAQYEKVRGALEDAMDAEKQQWAFCPDCEKKVRVDYPDHSARIRAIELWLEQGFGKAGTAAATVSAVERAVALSRAEMEELDDDHLAALAWGAETLESRAAYFVALRALDLPPGFGEALQGVEAFLRGESRVAA
jgi:hypothetical protein